MPDSTCSISDCDKPKHRRGWCSMHYRRWRTNGDPLVGARPSRKTCLVGGCSEPAVGKGYCRNHYYRFKKYGDPNAEVRSWTSNQGKTCYGPECDRPARSGGLCGAHRNVLERSGELRPLKLEYKATLEMSVQDRIEYYSLPLDANGCRLWNGALDSRGYPIMGHRDFNTRLVHRMAYMLATGETLEKHQPIHHKCGNTRCVEPSHLQLVETWENSAEMLERNFYLKRIAELEAALADASPDHPLLEATK